MAITSSYTLYQLIYILTTKRLHI